MKNKNAYYVVAAVLLLIIIGVVWYSARLNKSQPQPQTGAQPQVVGQTQDNKGVSTPPGMPKFIGGIVSKIEGQNVFIKAGTEEKTITTDAKTVIINEVKDGESSYKNVPATFKDIKISSDIVVYYSQNSGLEYKADKIQILPF